MDGLAMPIGSHCEIVLHSFAGLKNVPLFVSPTVNIPAVRSARQLPTLRCAYCTIMTGADSSVSKCYFTRAKAAY